MSERKTLGRRWAFGKGEGHPTDGPIVKTSVPEYPVTCQRQPFERPGSETGLRHAGVARASIAASSDHPNGTETQNWANEHKNMTVLQQHCNFFDPDSDGIIWPRDTYYGFRKLGFNIFTSAIAMLIIHANFSYPTVSGILPDAFFRIYLNNIHKDKHGSDTGAYDTEGRFIPQKFEDFFSKYGTCKDQLTKWDIWKGLSGQRVIMDPVGWGAEVLEWLAVFLFLWPSDGYIKKEDVRRIYDGSIFYETAAKNSKPGARTS